ncbi:Mannose-6-phosphate isomerase [Pelagerythrobacter marensis]|uniref:Mannose-6-phosphate isomerase n=1 Tax=Pelagerythrobacter marensis TaxID=543877 RepID=A0A0G3X3W5_9SPHN|nr:Mannose-6-phosphate isomerase [Pelagerythrobacter marensis]
MTARALPTRAVAKVWGRDRLPAPFAAPEGERIGEIWFEPPPELPGILAKYLFTSEKLSVQVHPDDAQAPPGTRGKEECWLVLNADPGASLAIGFDGPLSKDAMRAAALDGSIEGLLTWYPVKAGDFFYLPAGTVHAIGPGLSLVEIQQNSDVTYRLYDYGRPRELHLDAAIAVAKGEPYDAARYRRATGQGAAMLVEGPHFRLDRVSGPPGAAVAARYRGALLVMPLDGHVVLDGTVIAAGECGLADRVGAVDFARCGSALLVQPVSSGAQ